MVDSMANQLLLIKSHALSSVITARWPPARRDEPYINLTGNLDNFQKLKET